MTLGGCGKNKRMRKVKKKFMRYGDVVVDFYKVSYCQLNPADTRGDVCYCQFTIDGKVFDLDSEYSKMAFADFCEWAGVSTDKVE